MATTIDAVDMDKLEEISWQIFHFQKAAQTVVTENMSDVLDGALSLLKNAWNTQEAAFLNNNQRHFLEGVASALHENHANPLAFVREVKKLAHEPGQP